MRRTPKFFIVVNQAGSKFAKALQGKLSEKVDHRVLRTTKPVPGFLITANPKDKIEQFQRFSANQVPSPRFTTDRNRIGELGNRDIFARTTIRGTNGRGIVEFNSGDESIPEAPLYTEYIPKKSEYRVHVYNGEVIDIQQKRRRSGVDGNPRIRNLDNGYVYCRNGIDPPDGIANLAISAVNAVGYHYGAVDIIYNQKRNQCYVLEVNSRPGLEGTTLDKYADAIIKEFNL